MGTVARAQSGTHGGAERERRRRVAAGTLGTACCLRVFVVAVILTAALPARASQFGNIRIGGKDAHRDESVGQLKLHAEGVGWKSRVSGNIVSISKADLRKAEWLKIPHAYQLRLKARGGFSYKYNGFRSSDKETVRSYLQTTFGLELEEAQLSYKGWNWGQATVEAGTVNFAVESKLALELPLNDVSQATAQKNEAVIEMQDDDTANPEDEIITEMRFFLPPNASEDAADVEGTPAEGFVELLKQSGDLEVAGASLLTLDDLQVQVPRGRYDIELCDKFMKLHGKTNDYKVLYTNVAALYLLPKPDGHHMALSISLEHPLRQGATSYPHIVLQLPREEPLDVEVQLSEKECASRFADKLEKFESGNMPSVVAKVISAFTKRKVVGIKSGGFNAESRDDRNKSIRCSLKAQDGFLFPLDKAFYFLSNKPVHIELDRVASIEFNRVEQGSSSSAARTFDVTVHLKDSSPDCQFVNLQRQDYKEFLRFLQAKKLRIKNFASASYADGRGSRDDAEEDPYMNQIRREREEAQAAGDSEDDDSDDEEDEDFVGGDDSDVDEEYDEGGDGSDDERAFKKKKKKKKKAEGSSDDSGSGSDDSEEEKKPKKKKSAKAEGKRPADDEPELGIMASSKSAKRKGDKSPAGKKKKAKKDKNAPKKGLSAYFLWMNGVGRGEVKASNPEAGIGEIGKMCGERWREMGEADKAVWEAKAKEDKARYEREMAEYKAQAAGEPDDDDNDDDDE